MAASAASGGEPISKKPKLGSNDAEAKLDGVGDESGGVPAPQTPITDPDVVLLDIDDMLDKHWGQHRREPSHQNLVFPIVQVEALCNKVQEILANQPMLLQLEAPLKLCGDVHGQYHDLLRIFEHAGPPPQEDYLFLGDYVDRGKKSCECVLLLFAYKVKYPENFFLLRGNHESPSICRIYGFYDECKRRYNIKLWKTFCDVFNWLPACAVIADRVMCMHGGLSPEMVHPQFDTLSAIDELERPADIPDAGLLCDLLWADPGEGQVEGFRPNDRGVSVAFSAQIVDEFLRKEDLDLIVRAHQVVEDGYEFFRDSNRKVVTIFSAPNYCGEFDNAAAVMTVAEDLLCSFLVLRPSEI